MMEGAFFVSRSELLSWANDFFDLNLTKVEQCANGAVYCQVIDACHPGKVAMRKVNWVAKNDHEFIPNYKVLQAAFDKSGITKNIPVDMLIRGKYQDNLEMLQWMKHYFENTYYEDIKTYDPVPCRQGMKLPDWAKSRSGDEESKENVRPQRSRPSAPTERADPVLQQRAERPATGGYPKARVVPKAAATPSGRAGPKSPSARQEEEKLQAEVESLREEMSDLKCTVDGLEGERDYYFRKLRDIEILCQTLEAKGTPSEETTTEKLIADVQAILYAKDDPDGDEENQ
jgi:RP/EB family microtubule-associated protein